MRASQASAPAVSNSGETQAESAVNQQPISGFARQVRGRRSLDTALTLAAIHRSLAGRTLPPEDKAFHADLTRLEDAFESRAVGPLDDVAAAQEQAAALLARPALR